MTRTLTAVRRAGGPLAGIGAFTALSLVLTGLIAGTLARGVSGSTHSYQALFRDATGLRPGDDVRIAGVRVGRVESLQLVGGEALVRFDVASGQPVYRSTIATVDYLNLMGQRYVGLTTQQVGGAVLAPGATIPVSHTREGLDLTALFNAFKPVFEMLKPADINELANNLVQTLQGEGPTLRDLTSQTAALTQHLANRDQVIGAVIDNMTAVMQTVDDHRDQIAGLVHDLDGLTSSLAQNRQQISATIDSVQQMVSSFASLVADGGTSVDRDVSSLAAWSTSFAQETPQVAAALRWTQDLLIGYIRSLGAGSYLNTYVCTSSIQLGTGPMVPILNDGQHSMRCP